MNPILELIQKFELLLGRLDWGTVLVSWSLLGLAWILNKIVSPRLQRTFEYKLDTRLIEFQTDLENSHKREFEEQRLRMVDEFNKQNLVFSTLNSSVLSDLNNRQSVLHSKRIESTQELWIIAVEVSSNQRNVSTLATIHYDEFLKRKQKNRAEFELILGFFSEPEPDKLNNLRHAAEKLKPFIDDNIWDIFDALWMVFALADLRYEEAKLDATGLFENNIYLQEAVLKVLPDKRDFVEKFGEKGIYSLVQDLKNQLFFVIQKTVNVVHDDYSNLRESAQTVAATQKAFEQLQSDRLRVEADKSKVKLD